MLIRGCRRITSRTPNHKNLGGTGKDALAGAAKFKSPRSRRYRFGDLMSCQNPKKNAIR
jgi:hypothetical protein